MTKEDGIMAYWDVEYPPDWDEWAPDLCAAWRKGVNAALRSRDEDKARGYGSTADGVRTVPGEDNVPEDTGTSLSRDVSAFLAVTEDRVQEARRIVKGMSGRDRAVLSFWLQELSRIVEDAELSRRI